MTRRVRRAVALPTMGAALRCGGAKVVPPPPEPAVLPLDVQVIASPRPNLDEQGESLPAAVRLSLLKSASRLQPVGGCDGLAPACPK